jgi:hypothetical protein
MATTMFATVIHAELPTPSTPSIDPDFRTFPVAPHAPTKQRQPLPPGTHILSPGTHILSPGTFATTKRKLIFPTDNTTPTLPASPREPYKTLADEALQQLFRT